MSGTTFPASITVTQGGLAPCVTITPGASGAPLTGAGSWVQATATAPEAILMEDGDGPVLLEDNGGEMLLEAR